MTYVIVTDQVTLINEDPVLNECASLLAQSLRESEDELTRSYIAGVKLTLIDMEILRDDMGQAKAA